MKTGDFQLAKEKVKINFIKWYRNAYKYSNVEEFIVKRNIAIISDAFNSCQNEEIFKPFFKRK